MHPKRGESPVNWDHGKLVNWGQIGQLGSNLNIQQMNWIGSGVLIVIAAWLVH